MIDQNENKEMVKGFLQQSIMEARKDISLQQLAEVILDSIHHDDWIDFERILGGEINRQIEKRQYGK